MRVHRAPGRVRRALGRQLCASCGQELDQVARRDHGGQLGAGSNQLRVGRRRCFEALHHVIDSDILGEQAEIARVESHSGEQVAKLGACPQHRSPAQIERKNTFCRLSPDYSATTRSSYSFLARRDFRSAHVRRRRALSSQAACISVDAFNDRRFLRFSKRLLVGR